MPESARQYPATPERNDANAMTFLTRDRPSRFHRQFAIQTQIAAKQSNTPITIHHGFRAGGESSSEMYCPQCGHRGESSKTSRRQ
jgi:hypothetical protein